MKRIIFLVAVGLLASFGSLPADSAESTGEMNFQNLDVLNLLPIYKKMSGLELVVDSHVKAVHAYVTLRTLSPVTKGEAVKRIEKALLDQAGVVIFHLDEKRVSVTYNDALPVAPVTPDK